jgi:hypothetical protein
MESFVDVDDVISFARHRHLPDFCRSFGHVYRRYRTAAASA